MKAGDKALRFRTWIYTMVVFNVAISEKLLDRADIAAPRSGCVADKWPLSANSGHSLEIVSHLIQQAQYSTVAAEQT